MDKIETPYEYDESEISAVRKFLHDCARKKKIIHYDDAFEVARNCGMYYGPHDKRLWDLLGIISEREIQIGRGALSAIVTVKGTDLPGDGFFKLEQRLGRYRVDDVTTWGFEVKEIF